MVQDPPAQMSLGIVIRCPEGVVLAAESRVTLAATPPPPAVPLHVNFDNATKLLSFSEPNTAVGVVTYGQAALGVRTASSFVPEFEVTLPKDRLSVEELSTKLSAFFVDQWNAAVTPPYTGPDMVFVIGGFDEGEPYGKVYLVSIPSAPAPALQGAGDDFGITWGGQNEIAARILMGYDPKLPEVLKAELGVTDAQVQAVRVAMQAHGLQVAIQAMALQDAVDLAVFLIRATIDGQQLSVGVRGCGGFIDIATVTRRAGLGFVQRKQLRGERLAYAGEGGAYRP